MAKKSILEAFLIVLVLIGVLIGLSFIAPRSHEAPRVQQLYVPPFSEQTKVALQKSNGFQLAISYTDAGFQPAVATIKKGQTIRFTNNSSKGLQVASQDQASLTSCGSGVFNSCKQIGRGEFWEFTFDKAGTWRYENTLDAKKTGSVRVQ